MNEPFDVSVVICTYNRCDLLPGALESVLTQESKGARFEVIVVDNNSTDRTRQVVESHLGRSSVSVRYVFEGRQGLSHARNTGIAYARAPIIAFTDDDVRAAPDWVAAIKRAFDEQIEADFVGGKVLPRWRTPLPAWLTRDHWAPLALSDFGDQQFYSNADRPVCLIGASLAFRRDIFARVGLFAAEVQRMKDGIGSMEDHEMLMRVWQLGRKGLYDPRIVVTTDVQVERMTKAYHRRWHAGHGRFYALVRVDEIERSHARLFDAPAHFYRQLPIDALAWLKHALQGRQADAFEHELRMRFIASFIRKRRQDFRAARGRGTAREVMAFVTALLRSRLRRVRNRLC